MHAARVNRLVIYHPPQIGHCYHIADTSVFGIVQIGWDLFFAPCAQMWHSLQTLADGVDGCFVLLYVVS